MALATALIVRWTQQALPHLQAIGGLIGMTVSRGFLILIGVINLFIWIDVYLIFVQMRGRECDAQALEHLLLSGA